MKITKEKIDKELYMDLALSVDEVEALAFYRCVSKSVKINKKTFTVTVRMDRSGSVEDDTYEFYEDF